MDLISAVTDLIPALILVVGILEPWNWSWNWIEVRNPKHPSDMTSTARRSAGDVEIPSTVCKSEDVEIPSGVCKNEDLKKAPYGGSESEEETKSSDEPRVAYPGICGVPRNIRIPSDAVKSAVIEKNKEPKAAPHCWSEEQSCIHPANITSSGIDKISYAGTIHGV